MTLLCDLRPARIVLTVALTLSLVLAPVAANAAPVQGADSPEEAMRGVQAALEVDDIGGALQFVAPESRLELTMALLLGATMFVAFAQMGAEMAEGMEAAFADEQAAESAEAAESGAAAARAETAGLEAELNEILARHGLQDELLAKGDEGGEALAQAMAEIDQSALASELIAFLRGMGVEEAEGPPPGMPTGTLEDLVVDGDRATGTVDGEPVDFIRLEGRWYLEP